MDVKKYTKEQLFEVAESLTKEDIEELISNLMSKDDKVRYPSFLILKRRSEIEEDVYKYWNKFIDMINSDNSYHITIGLSLISINTIWDKDDKLSKVIDKYLNFCDYEKLITARLAIQGLINIIKGTNYNDEICRKIVNKLISIKVEDRADTHIKLILTDIINILIEIEKEIHYKEIIIYLNKCVDSNIIDKNLKENIKEMLE